jgi:hypothetical protein
VVISELRDRGVSYADYLAGATTQSATRKAEVIEANVFVTPVFRWTKCRRMKALSLHDDGKNTPAFIASQLGCTLQELTDFLSASDESI